METRTVTAQLPAPLADKIDEMATRLDRPANWVIERALAAWVGGDCHHQETLHALAEVDAGLLIDDDFVKAWAESLGTPSELPPPFRA